MVWRLRFWRVLHTHRLLVGTGGRCLCVIVVGGKEGNVYFSRKFVHPRLDEKTHFPPVRANPRLDGSFLREIPPFVCSFCFLSFGGVVEWKKKKRTDGASNSTLGSGKVTRRMKCRPRPRLATFRLQNFPQSRIKLPL